MALDDRVYEGSTWLVTAAFTDDNGIAVTPTSARYRIDDVKSGQNIVAAADVPSLGSSAEIEITPAQNAVINDRYAIEPRRLTLVFVYGAARQRVAEYKYDLINLRFAPVG